ncbi:hypothetical protein ACNQ2I_00725 [Mycoplasma sp. Z355B]|uniref:hypothetical protein n=1 Tax=Mycoplasma sp. Z355B TaxID=3401689 RepID=UPI003AAF7F5E
MKSKRIKSQSENTFNGIFSLINIHFWKAFVGPFFAFGYPIIFIVVCGLIFNYPMIASSSLTIGPVAIACVSLPTAIFEFKKSTLLKRIGATKIKPLVFLLYVASYYFIIMFLSGLWTLFFTFIIFGPDYFTEGKVVYSKVIGGVNYHVSLASLKQIFQQIEVGGLIYSLLTLTLVSLAVGLFIVSVSKSILMIQALGSTLLIISMFLTGQVFPMVAVSEVKGMWWFSYISPFKSSITQNKMAFEGSAYLTPVIEISGKEINFAAKDAPAIYALNDYMSYLESVAKYTQALKRFPLLQGDEIKPEIDQLLHHMHNIATSEFNSVAFEKYNIFDVNKTYYSVNSLKTIQPLVVPFESVLNQTVHTSLNDVLASGKGLNDNNVLFLQNLALGANASVAREGQFQQLIQNLNASNLDDSTNQIVQWIKIRPDFSSDLKSYILMGNKAISQDDLIQIGSKAENIINLILPYIWSVLLFGLSAKSFKWSTR